MNLFPNKLKYGAQEKTRTSTTLRPQVPETCASTSSATWAIGGPTLLASNMSTVILASSLIPLQADLVRFIFNSYLEQI